MNNKMTGKYLVWGYRENDLRSSIYVVLSRNNDLKSSLTIKPVNKMTGIFSVAERPLEKHFLSPIKDSTIRENIPTINYGSDTGMMVGVDEYNGEKYRSLIQFDLSSLPPDKVLKRATLKLYATPYSDNIVLSVYNLLNNWLENYVTWANQPREGEKFAISSVKVNEDGYFEIDITPLVEKWYQKTIPNYGLLLIAEDETKRGSILFGTRESIYPPVLELGFEIPVINDSQSNLMSSITVEAIGQNTLLSRINVISNYRENTLNSLIQINEYSGTSTLLCSIVAEKQRLNELLGSIQVNKIEESDSLLGSLVAATNNDLRASFQVETIEGHSGLLGSLVVPTPNDLRCSISIPADNYLKAQLSIEKQQKSNTLLSSITAAHNNDLLSSISVNIVNANNDLLSSIITFTNNDLRSLVNVAANNDLLSRIRVEYTNELLSSIHVDYSSDLLSQIQVVGVGQNDLLSSIIAEVKMISDLRASIRVVDTSGKRNYQYAYII